MAGLFFLLATGYSNVMKVDPIIRLCAMVGSTSRAAGSYKPW